MVRALLFSFRPTLSHVPTARSDCYCEGCGCKGGPGWRDADGHCVSHKALLKVCGNPPNAKCKFEGAKQVCPGERAKPDVPPP